MLHSSLHAQVVDALLHSPFGNVEPYCGLVLLPNAIDTSNGLQLDSRVDERLAEEHIVGADKIQPVGVGTGVEKKDFYSRVFLEFSGASVGIDRRKADAEAFECCGKNLQKVPVPNSKSAETFPYLVAKRYLDYSL